MQYGQKKKKVFIKKCLASFPDYAERYSNTCRMLCVFPQKHDYLQDQAENADIPPHSLTCLSISKLTSQVQKL